MNNSNIDVDIRGNADSLNRAGKQAENSLEDMRRKVVSTGQAMNSIGDDAAKLEHSMGRAALVGTLLGNALSDGVGKIAAHFAASIKHVFDLGDQLSKMSEKTHMSAEELSALRFVASQSDVEFETLGKGLVKLNRHFNELAGGARTDAALAMRSLGIEARDGSGRILQGSEALMTFAKGLESIEDPAARTQKIIEVFGERFGSQLIPVFAEGAEGIHRLMEEAQRLGIVMDAEAAEAARRFNDNLDAVKKSGERLVITLGNSLLPEVKQISEAMRDAAADGGVLKAVWIGFGGIAENTVGKQWRATFKGVAAEALESLAKVQQAAGNMFGASVSRQKAGALWKEIADMSPKPAAAPPKAGKGGDTETLVEQMRAFESLKDRVARQGKNSFQLAMMEADRLGMSGKMRDEFSALASQLKDKEAKAPKRKFVMQDNVDSTLGVVDKNFFAATGMTYEQSQEKDKADQLAGQQADHLMAKSEEAFKKKQEHAAFEISLIGKTAAEQALLNEERRIDVELEREIFALYQNDKLKNRDELIAQVAQAYRLGASAAKDFARSQADLADKRSRDWTVGAVDGLNSYIDAASRAGTSTANAVSQGFRMAEDVLTNFVRKGKLDLRGLAEYAADQFIRIRMVQPLMRDVADWSKGINFSNIGSTIASWFGGARAGGGDVDAGMTYLVGEKGPELLRMGASGGSIVPNHALGGDLTVNVYNAPSTPRVTQRSDGRGGSQIDIVFEQIDSYLANNIAGGTGPTSAVLDRLGLNRVAGAF